MPNSQLKPLDLDKLTRPTVVRNQSQPSTQSAPQRKPVDYRNWLMVVMAAAIVFLAFLLIGRGVIPIPEPGPVIDISGQYVLLVVDEGGNGGLSTEQLAVTNSAKVADWCTEHDVEYRRFDVDEDLALEDPVWTELAKLVDRPPAMVTLMEGKATVREFPSGVDDAIDQLSGVFK